MGCGCGGSTGWQPPTVAGKEAAKGQPAPAEQSKGYYWTGPQQPAAQPVKQA